MAHATAGLKLEAPVAPMPRMQADPPGSPGVMSVEQAPAGPPVSSPGSTAPPMAPTQVTADPWQAADDHRTLTRAVEIQQDPVRLACVRQHHRKLQRRMATVGKVIGSRRR